MKNKYKPQPTSAFTLVELSVSIVIIATMLVIAIVSKQLITSARLNKVQQEIKDIDTISQIFLNTFDCLPGDCSIKQLRQISTKVPSDCFNLQSDYVTPATTPAVTTGLNTGQIDSAAKRTCAFYEMQALESQAFGGSATSVVVAQNINSLMGVNSANAIGTQPLSIVDNPVINSAISSQANTLTQLIATNNTTIQNGLQTICNNNGITYANNTNYSCTNNSAKTTYNGYLTTICNNNGQTATNYAQNYTCTKATSNVIYNNLVTICNYNGTTYNASVYVCPSSKATSNVVYNNIQDIISLKSRSTCDASITPPIPSVSSLIEYKPSSGLYGCYDSSNNYNKVQLCRSLNSSDSSSDGYQCSSTSCVPYTTVNGTRRFFYSATSTVQGSCPSGQLDACGNIGNVYVCNATATAGDGYLGTKMNSDISNLNAATNTIIPNAISSISTANTTIATAQGNLTTANNNISNAMSAIDAATTQNIQYNATLAALQGQYISLSFPTATNPVVAGFETQAMWDMRTVNYRDQPSTGLYPYELTNNVATTFPRWSGKMMVLARSSSNNNDLTDTGNMAAFTSTFAKKYDTKFDDGLPYSGNIVAGKNSGDMNDTNGCTNINASSWTNAVSDASNTTYVKGNDLNKGCVMAALLKAFVV